jgi:predicted subunit of tRNA(5-methylaminomethyl-2-thiouridylate) methyltransferase
LLKKVEQEEEEWVQNNAEFETRLREILKRHKVDNEPFFSEVSNLHKMLSD